MATNAGPRPANSSSAASSADADSAERGGHSSKETKRPAPIRSETVATGAAYCGGVVDLAPSRRSPYPCNGALTASALPGAASTAPLLVRCGTGVAQYAGIVGPGLAVVVVTTCLFALAVWLGWWLFPSPA